MDGLIQIIMLLLGQILYMSLLVWMRPFREAKNNIMEIINECFFVSLILMLTAYNKKHDWTKTAENGYLGLIMANSIIISAIMLSKLLII